MIDKERPLFDGQIPEAPERWGSVVSFPRETLNEFRDRFSILEQFAAIVTKKDNPSLIDLLTWTYQEYQEGRIPEEKAKAAILFFQHSAYGGDD